MHHSYVDGYHPKTKAALKAAVKAGGDVYLEDTSMFRQYCGTIQNMPEGVRLDIVGPHAYDRRWYANIIRHGDKVICK